MRTIMLANQKGGVGKTTTSIELCNNLSSNAKVLGIDMDPQGSMTKASGVRFDNKTYSLQDVLLGECRIEQAIQHTDNYDIIAASKKLADASKVFTGIDDIYILDDILNKYMELKYDYIIIDNAPGRSPLLYMSYIASDYIIIPTDADLDSLDGIDEIMDDINKFRKRNTTKIQVLGTLLIAYEKTTIHDAAYEALKMKADITGAEPFKNKISKTVRVKEAKTMKMGLLQYASSNKEKIKAANDYKKFTAEVINRIEKIEKGE